MEDGIAIERLTEATAEDAAALAALLVQLREREHGPSVEHLARVVAGDAARVVVARRDGRIVGTATLILAPIVSGTHAYVEDVVVDEAERGHGIAARLVDALLDVAARAGAEKVELTSNPSREAANRLYLRLGFETRGTNVYRYRIEEG